MSIENLFVTNSENQHDLYCRSLHCKDLYTTNPPSTNPYGQITFSPHGFENQTDSQISFEPLDMIFLINPVITSYNYWYRGNKIVQINNYSLSIPSTQGLYIIYFDSNGILQYSTTPVDYRSTVPIAILYWYSVTKWVLFNERHECKMDTDTHTDLHMNVGAFLLSGGAISNYLLNPVTPTNLGNQYTIASSVICDEDIKASVSSISASTGYNVNQLSGPSGVWNYDNLAYPFNWNASTGYIQYNQFTGGNWVLTDCPTNRFFNMYVCLTPSIDPTKQIFLKASQSTYASLANAQAENFLSLTLSPYAPQEIVPVYQITYDTDTLFTNIGKCRIVSVRQINNSKTYVNTTITGDYIPTANLTQTVTFPSASASTTLVPSERATAIACETRFPYTGGTLTLGGTGILQTSNGNVSLSDNSGNTISATSQRNSLLSSNTITMQNSSSQNTILSSDNTTLNGICSKNTVIGNNNTNILTACTNCLVSGDDIDLSSSTGTVVLGDKSFSSSTQMTMANKNRSFYTRFRVGHFLNGPLEIRLNDLLDDSTGKITFESGMTANSISNLKFSQATGSSKTINFPSITNNSDVILSDNLVQTLAVDPVVTTTAPSAKVVYDTLSGKANLASPNFTGTATVQNLTGTSGYTWNLAGSSLSNSVSKTNILFGTNSATRNLTIGTATVDAEIFHGGKNTLDLNVVNTQIRSQAGGMIFNWVPEKVYLYAGNTQSALRAFTLPIVSASTLLMSENSHISQTITDGETTKCPSNDAVYDQTLLKSVGGVVTANTFLASNSGIITSGTNNTGVCLTDTSNALGGNELFISQSKNCTIGVGNNRNSLINSQNMTMTTNSTDNVSVRGQYATLTNCQNCYQTGGISGTNCTGCNLIGDNTTVLTVTGKTNAYLSKHFGGHEFYGSPFKIYNSSSGSSAPVIISGLGTTTANSTTIAVGDQSGARTYTIPASSNDGNILLSSNLLSSMTTSTTNVPSSGVIKSYVDALPFQSSTNVDLLGMTRIVSQSPAIDISTRVGADAGEYILSIVGTAPANTSTILLNCTIPAISIYRIQSQGVVNTVPSSSLVDMTEHTSSVVWNGSTYVGTASVGNCVNTDGTNGLSAIAINVLGVTFNLSIVSGVTYAIRFQHTFRIQRLVQ